MTHTREDVPLTMRGQLRRSRVGPWRISTIDLLTQPNAALVALLDLFLDAAHGRPKLRYETMVFLGDESRDQDVARYDTPEAALAGHEAMCAKWAEVPVLADGSEVPQ